MFFDERAVTITFDGIVRIDQSNAHMLKDMLFGHAVRALPGRGSGMWPCASCARRRRTCAVIWLNQLKTRFLPISKNPPWAAGE
jgi:hypothetical protein